jgi:N-acetylglucosamine-6-sulfatase
MSQVTVQPLHAIRGPLRAIGLLLGVGACLGLAACGGSSPPPSRSIPLLPPSVRLQRPPGPSIRRPNIVFVLTDDLSVDLLRFMPRVLAMERHGLTFRDYFVSDSLCCPSRASIFTGNFPHDTHVFGNTGSDHGGYSVFYRRGEEAHTFAIALQRAGYLTGMMGKYLNGYLQPLAGSAGAAADVPMTRVPPGWNQWDVAGQGYPEFNYRLNQNGVLRRFGHQPSDYLTDVLARKGIQFIDVAAARHQPFFLELATFAPHSPYVPAPRDAHDFPGLRAPRPPNFDVLPTHPPLWLAVHRRLSRPQIAQVNRAFRRRAQAVQAVDRMIGDVEQALAATGAARNTYIVFSSDNGLHTGEYRLMPGKLTAFDTDIHVPLVVTGPGVKPGATTRQMAENIDLAKTFTAIGGTTLPGDGHSLLSLFHGHPTASWRNAVLIEHRSPLLTVLDPDFQQPASGRPPSYEAMRTAQFLYVEYKDGEREYYDLRTDPFELHNVIRRLSHRERLVLHLELKRMELCHGGPQCWQAMHVARAPVVVPSRRG